MGHERETDAETGGICFHDDDKGMDPCTKAVWGVPAAIAPERSEGTYCAHNGNHREYDGQSDGELEQRLLNPAARTERRLRSTEEARTLSPHLHEDDSYEKDGHHYHSYLEKRLHYPPPMDASFS